MSRYAPRNRYQVGGVWLGQRSGSDAWYRMWCEPGTRRTKRASLGTTDFDEAKARLNEWFILNQTVSAPNATSVVTLAEVFARFFEQHGQHLKSASDTSRSLRYWLDFHREATIDEALLPNKQTQFRQWLSDHKNLAPGTVRRVLSVGKAALNWSWKRGEVGPLPYIQLVPVPRPEPKGRPLEVEEVADLFKATTQQHLAVFMVLMIATAGRTGAILDLTYDQIDLRRKLIDLNPLGRSQTKKYRPMVRLPEQLVEYISKTVEAGKPIVSFEGAPIDCIRRSWRQTRKRSGLLGNVQTYSFRHTMARWMRSQSVPAWEVAAQLGHKAPDYSTTEIYAPFDPTYLGQATTATDEFLRQVAEQLGASSMSKYLLTADLNQTNGL